MELKYIDIATAKEWIDDGDVAVLDVREPDEYAEGHIESAVNYPLSSLDSNKISAACEGKRVIMHCKVDGRATMACTQLLSECGKEHDIYIMKGGFSSWNQAGYPFVV